MSISVRYSVAAVVAGMVLLVLFALVYPLGWTRVPHNSELYKDTLAPEEMVQGLLVRNERRFLVILENASIRYVDEREVERIKLKQNYLEIREAPWFYKVENPFFCNLGPPPGLLRENATKYLLVRLGEDVSPDFLEEFVGEEVEVFGRRHDIQREHDPHTIWVLGTEFIPKRIRETQ